MCIGERVCVYGRSVKDLQRKGVPGYQGGYDECFLKCQ